MGISSSNIAAHKSVPSFRDPDLPGFKHVEVKTTRLPLETQSGTRISLNDNGQLTTDQPDARIVKTSTGWEVWDTDGTHYVVTDDEETASTTPQAAPTPAPAQPTSTTTTSPVSTTATQAPPPTTTTVPSTTAPAAPATSTAPTTTAAPPASTTTSTPTTTSPPSVDGGRTSDTVPN